jgi:8-oxo-dGTP pyrophosphatase MutT (NUDIX family)
MTGMESDHFTFHLQKLLELGLIEKISRGLYTLTQRGKEYANKLDTDNNTIERQPKVAVILVVERQMNGETQYVFQERRKQPFYGFWGCPTGKVRWGETIVETAARELLEETGLTAQYRMAGVYHELVYAQESGEQLEDKIFFVVHCTEPSGELFEEFEGGHNEWMTRKEALKQPKIFTSFDIEIDIVTSDEVFVDRRVEYTKELF